MSNNNNKFTSKMVVFSAKGLACTLEGRIYSKGLSGAEKKYVRTSLMVSNRTKTFEYVEKTLQLTGNVNYQPPYNTDREGNVTHFLEVVAFNQVAERLEKSVKAGDYVMMTGDLVKNEGPNGKVTLQMIVQDFKMIKASEKTEAPKEVAKKQNTSTPAPVADAVEMFDADYLDEDDLPF